MFNGSVYQEKIFLLLKEIAKFFCGSCIRLLINNYLQQFVHTDLAKTPSKDKKEHLSCDYNPVFTATRPASVALAGTASHLHHA